MLDYWPTDVILFVYVVNFQTNSMKKNKQKTQNRQNTKKTTYSNNFSLVIIIQKLKTQKKTKKN